MAINVTITNVGPNETLDIVRELREKGHVQGKDFDFHYYQGVVDPSTYELVNARHAKFTFYDEKLATLYALKYGR